MTYLSTLKTHLRSTASLRVKLMTTRTFRPLKAVLGGDMPNLDGYGDRNVWGELIDSALDSVELPENLKLLLFFENCLDMNPKPFLF